MNATQTNTVPEFLTVQDITRLTRLSRAKVYGLIEQHLLPAYRFGRAVRVSREDFERFLASNRDAN